MVDNETKASILDRLFSELENMAYESGDFDSEEKYQEYADAVAWAMATIEEPSPFKH